MHRFQIVQDAADRLRLRLDVVGAGARKAAWHAAAGALRDYLRQQALPNVRVTLDPHPPTAEPRSGKLRQVIATAAA